jgi:hypothetical protein
MIRTFLQVEGLVLAFVSAYFLVKGNIGLSAENIAKIASTKFGHNPDVVHSLAQQRAHTWIGFFFFITASLFSLCNTLWPMRWVDFNVNKGAAAFALALAPLLFFVACPLSKKLTATYEQRVKKILEKPSAQEPTDSPSQQGSSADAPN